MSVDLNEYKQIEDSHYYINSKGEVFNKKLQRYLKINKSGCVQIRINNKPQTSSVRKLVSKLFGYIDLNEYKQIEDSNYYINKEGEVVNKYNKKIATRNCNNYVTFEYCNKEKKASMYIHRAVAQTFLPNPENLPEVHHKDNNKSNNHLDNLEWTTKSMNCRMSYKKKKSGLPRGVSYNNVAKKYQAQISIDCRIKHLGYYDDVEKAHQAYLSKYEEVMGKKCIYI